MLVAVLFASALLNIQRVADPAPAPSAAPAAEPAKPSAKKPAPKDDDIVCNNIDVEGTRFSKRVCHTRAEWAMMTQDAQTVRDTLNQDMPARGETMGGMMGMNGGM